MTSFDVPKVRRPEFGLEHNFRKYYADGNPILTHVLNSLHVVFPEGEKFFIRAVKKFNIDNEKLKAQVKGFFGQETQHMFQHEKLWETLESQGVKVNEYNEWYKKDAYGKIEDGLRSLLGEELGNKLALSVTCALEHYTATLAEVVLDNEDVLEGFDDNIRNLLLWHAAEEIEHKSVAFNVMQEVDKSQAIKAVGMVIGTWALFYYSAIGAAKFISEDKDLKTADVLKNSKLPLVGKIAAEMTPKILKYFAFDFHPDKMRNKYYAYLDGNPVLQSA